MPAVLELFCLGIFLTANPSSELQAELENFISTCNAEIGVAVITDSGETICINGESPYPLHSVAKLHQAIAVADCMDHNELPLETEIAIQEHELQPDTFSPLRDEHPSGDFSSTIAELLKFSLQKSDNNACDLLFKSPDWNRGHQCVYPLHRNRTFRHSPR
ncbi:MAG: serine hydrolase [Alistipes senegalensis]|nr:serine hydrolase [Bacteroides cellulosilyticus]MCM1351458.1 serine hydrolase [Alistipes senegalensis]